MADEYVEWDRVQRYADHLGKKGIVIPKDIQKKLDKVEQMLNGPNDKFNVKEYQRIKAEIVIYFEANKNPLKKSA